MTVWCQPHSKLLNPASTGRARSPRSPAFLMCVTRYPSRGYRSSDLSCLGVKEASCCPQPAARPAIRDKLGRALFPRLGKRICTATSARNPQSLEAGQSEILVENSDGIATNHVLWSRNGVRRHWNTAGQRFELNDAKCIGSTGKHEHVCRPKVSRQGLSLQLTDEMGIRKATLQLACLRPVADDDLRTRQIERQKRGQIFFHCEAADTDENRAGQIDCRGAFRPEEVGIDAAGPHR